MAFAVPHSLAGGASGYVEEVGMSDLVERKFLINKRGMWYRPNSQGYTNNPADAGRYTEEEARDYTHPNGLDGPRDGMFYKHESEVDGAVNPLAAIIETQAARIAELEGVLKRARWQLVAHLLDDMDVEHAAKEVAYIDATLKENNDVTE